MNDEELYYKFASRFYNFELTQDLVLSLMQQARADERENIRADLFMIREKYPQSSKYETNGWRELNKLIEALAQGDKKG